MAVPVCSQEALFERLLRQFNGTYMLVRTTEAAHEKITASGLQSSTKIIDKALGRDKNVHNTAKVDFESESDLDRLGEEDLETQLLEAVTTNIPEFDSQELEFVGYPPWFTEWAVTLAKRLRTARYKTLDIPSESRSVMLFCTSDDSLETASKMLGDPESAIFRALVVFGENNAKTFLNHIKGTYKEAINHIVVNSDTKPLEECVMEDSFSTFLAKVAEACAAQCQLAVSSPQEKKKSVPHISSKAAKSKPTEADLAAMKSILMGMNEDLQGDSPTGYIDDVCGAADYEMQGLAYIYSALSQVKKMKKYMESLQKEDECKIDPKRIVEKAINDLDKAINILLKYNSKWDALLSAVFMATIGGDDEARRLGTISATMEIKSQSDFARAALSLELCTYFTQKQRKKMFYLVMAGQLFLHAGMMNLTKRCYMLALPLYKEKGWGLASDFLYGTLSRCEPLFCIDALNGMADNCELLNCYTNMESYDDSVCKSSWYSHDREMTHLRRLMKLSVANYAPDEIQEKNAATPICCAYASYPALLCGKKGMPPLDNNIPYLVRVPLVILRNNEGVPGKNCELLLTDSVSISEEASKDPPYNTADDFDLQEVSITKQVKAKAECDPLWKTCYEFISDYGNISYRLDTNSSGYNLPTQRTKNTSNCPLGAESVIKLELVNPLHIAIHCDEFHLLIKDDKETWWESASVLNLVHAAKTEEGQKKPNDNFVYLSEAERRIVHLKFKLTKPGTFHIVGFAWKLFGCVSCWVPLYVSGQRKTKGAPVQYKETELLDDFVDARLTNHGLSMSIHETYPQVSIALSKVTHFPANICQLSENDEHFSTLKHYFKAVDDDMPDDFNKEGYLSVDEAIADEFVITRLSVKNIGTSPIEAVTLNVKTSGICAVTNYPLGYRSQSNNVRVVWEDMAKCNLGCISGNKAYQVTLQDETGNLILPGGILSIFMLMVPRADDASPNILCIQGRLTMTSKSYNVDAKMAFWRFYSTTSGLSVSYKYHHSLKDMLQCIVVNESKKDMTSISFYDNTGSNITPNVRTPTFTKNRKALAIRQNSRLTSVIPFDLSWTQVKMCWECDNAFGLINSEISIDASARLLLKIRSEMSSIKYTGTPSTVRIEFVFENPTSATIPGIHVEAKPKIGPGNAHSWFYVGVLTGEVPEIPPNKSEHIGFDVVLPLPGMYVFSYNSITVSHTWDIAIIPCNELLIPVEV